jgi:hypothetical protein
MSDNGEVEVESTSYTVLPKDVQAEIGQVKLFNRWSYEDVEIRDISLTYVPFSVLRGNFYANWGSQSMSGLMYRGGEHRAGICGG